MSGEILFADGCEAESVGPEWRGKVVVVLGGLRGEAHDRAMRFRPLAIVTVMNQLATPPVRTELEKHMLCVNVDVQGALLGLNSSRVLGPSELTAAVKLLAKELGPAFEVKEQVYSSDGTPLSEGGIPSVSFSRSGATTSYLHTPGDQIDYLGPEPLAAQGQFIETFLQRYVAEARDFPFERKVPEEQQKRIREYFEKRLRIDYYAEEKKEQASG